MILHITAIKGNYSDTDTINSITDFLNYNDLNEDKPFEDWDTFNNYLIDNYYELSLQDKAIRGIWKENNWTIYNDPEMVDLIEEAELLELSNKLNTEILTFTIQSDSNSFEFTKYNKGKERHFFVCEGRISENYGKPLQQESGLNITKTIASHDIIQLANHIGIDLEGTRKNIYTVKLFEYNEKLKNELKKYKRTTNEESSKNKPWWKFW